MFCSGSGYWYKRRYVTQQQIVIGQPQRDPVVTMTTSQTTSTNGTCTRIPTGMTYHPSYYPPDSKGAPPAYSRTASDGQSQRAVGSSFVHIKPDGSMSVLYQTAPYGPPPSYDSIQACTGQGHLAAAPGPVSRAVASQPPPPAYHVVIPNITTSIFTASSMATGGQHSHTGGDQPDVHVSSHTPVTGGQHPLDSNA
jgi:hypothetical protein